jgi:hypothetical protein
MTTLAQNEIVEAARAHGATIVESPTQTTIVLSKRDDDELLPIERASEIAATTDRVLRAAINAAELPAFGGQRDRSVKRSDLETWIISRKVRIEEGPADDSIARRVRQIERKRAKR